MFVGKVNSNGGTLEQARTQITIIIRLSVNVYIFFLGDLIIQAKSCSLSLQYGFQPLACIINIITIVNYAARGVIYNCSVLPIL
jgi:hypothetical protein